jgi:membrane associated rhomboid family serine protease
MKFFRVKHFPRVFLLTLLIHATVSLADDSLAPNDAARHIGEQGAVCGIFASATYARGSRGSPTFLNLGKPHSNQSHKPVTDQPVETLMGCFL